MWIWAPEQAGGKQRSKAGGRDTNVIITNYDTYPPASGQCFVRGKFGAFAAIFVPEKRTN
jgi:hypothetical protein